jgi:negative regulator of flagellin synthesis FlgM
MKIDQNVTFLKAATGTAPLPPAKGDMATEASKAAAAASQARLTSPTPLLPSTNGDFDAARVAEIRASISAGRYQVNTAKIADGLLASVHELLNKGKP